MIHIAINTWPEKIQDFFPDEGFFTLYWRTNLIWIDLWRGWSTLCVQEALCAWSGHVLNWYVYGSNNKFDVDVDITGGIIQTVVHADLTRRHMYGMKLCISFLSN